MTKDESWYAADDDAAYLWRLINEQGIGLDTATAMVVARIKARLVADAIRPKKEPWQG